MGGVGSGGWYRFSKKTTVEECRSLDIRKLDRQGLLEPGYRFTYSWSRAGREKASIGDVVLGSLPPGAGGALIQAHERSKRGVGGRFQEPVELREGG